MYSYVYVSYIRREREKERGSVSLFLKTTYLLIFQLEKEIGIERGQSEPVGMIEDVDG